MTHTISYESLVFLVCFLAAAWFITFALLIRALQVMRKQDEVLAEGSEALKLAAATIVELQNIIHSQPGLGETVREYYQIMLSRGRA